MNIEAVYHRQHSEFAFVYKGFLVLRIRTKKNDFSIVSVLYQEKYDATISGAAEMEKITSDEFYDYFEVTLDMKINRIRYMFCLRVGDKVVWYNTQGFHKENPSWGHFSYAYIDLQGTDFIPAWFKNAVIYQIFPDRFCNNEISNGRTESKKLINEKENCGVRYGGNLEGIIDKLDHLGQLGVDTVYLNPIFEAKSYHGYDTIDYYNVDPSLGKISELKELVEKCHQRGIKIILDMVFNHCSNEFFAFKDIIVKGENSPYKDWFIVLSYPIKTHPQPNYECFSFFGGMPKLNFKNEEVVRYFIDVATFWVKEMLIDGLRFDVADEISRGFWRRLRTQLKAINENVVMVGEIWEEANSWLLGDQLDSVISYPFKSMITDRFAFNSIKNTQFKNRVNNHLMQYDLNIVKNLVNIIDSHDTARFLTECGENKALFKLAVVFQFTYPGVPLLYYGDEIGMLGASDPHCRKPMIWDREKWDHEILELYKLLILLRKNHECLTEGHYINSEFDHESGIIVYKRVSINETAIIILNGSNEKAETEIKMEAKFKRENFELISVKGKRISMWDNKIKIMLEPYAWDILFI